MRTISFTGPVHFIGIGGIGMSGLACILLQRGCAVSGSDIKESAIVNSLRQMGAKIFCSHEKSNVPEGAIVVYSTDIKEENPEYQEAKKNGLLWHRSRLLQELMSNCSALLVAGTHGKTTTSALLAHALMQAGKNPSYCIGGIVKSLQSQAGHCTGSLFVAEADESDGSFLAYKPSGVIITNIDEDHMNYWKTKENLIEGFVQFFSLASDKELCFWCKDDPLLRQQNFSGYSYGFSHEADLCITKAEYQGMKSIFSFSFQGKTYSDIVIPLIGPHNVLNTAAVCGLCLQVGVEPDLLPSLFVTFQGVGRRAEKKGEASGIVFYDDYAHHPTEIHTTLAALKKAHNGARLVVLFQPHRFTRVKDCFDQFAASLLPADLVLMTDVYGAGEEPIEGICATTLLQKMQSQGLDSCTYIAKEDFVGKAASLLQKEDVCVSMGAGDITFLGEKILKYVSV
jgi:UDP-N-acetylmuramate--alanine ligase